MQTAIIKPFDPKDPTKELKVLNWEATVVDPTDVIPDPIAILSRGTDEFCHLGDIQAIEGHSGSKKTFLVSAQCAALLEAQGEHCLQFDCQIDYPKSNRILLVDTEQSLGNVQKVQHRIYKMASIAKGSKDERLKVLSLREYNPDERLEIIKQAIISYKPNVMFIDNIKDLVNDFNDIEESQKLVGEVMKMSSGFYSKDEKGEPKQMAIICVIHQNFSSDKARGHLGSLIYEKASLVMTLKVEGDLTKVTYSKVRNAKPEDFFFQIDKASKLPVLACNSDKPHLDGRVLEVMFSTALENPMRHNDLVRILMKQEGRSEKTCRTYIKDAIAASIVIKNENLYELNKNNVLPF